MPYMDKDGRVKHIKKIGEEIPQQTPKGMKPVLRVLLTIHVLIN